MKKRINYSDRLLGFNKDRRSEHITSMFPVPVVKIKNSPNLEKVLFKAVVTNASEKIIFFEDSLFHKYQRPRFLLPPSEQPLQAVVRTQIGIFWRTGLGLSEILCVGHPDGYESSLPGLALSCVPEVS